MSTGLVRPQCPGSASAQVHLAVCAVLVAGGCVGSVADAPSSAGGKRPPTAVAGGGAVPGNGATAPACGGDATPARIWRLSDDEYRRAVADLLPGVTVPEVSTPGRARAEFINAAELYPVAGALVADLRTAAKAVAAAAVSNLPARLGCAPGQGERPCAEAFIEAFATRAFRRPLEVADRQALSTLFATGAAVSVGAGVQLVIEGVLQAPSFLYRTELGGPGAAARFELTAYERAAALSFFLLGSGPDDQLMRAAADGSLGRADGYAREIERLLGDARARENLARIMSKWTGLGDGVTTELAPEQYPDYDDALKQSLLEESNRFFADLARGGTIGNLLTTRRTFVDKRLAALYGVPYPGNGAFVEITLPADQRAGLFTQGAFLVNRSRGEPIVHRGKWVREELLCGDMPEPPPGVNTTAPVDPNLTARQFAQMRMDDMTCGACHQLMDGIGLTFGHYDALARYVTRDEQGRPIDSAGQVAGSDVAGPAGSILELAQRLAGSAQTRACIETRMLSYALGRDLSVEAVRCEQQAIDGQIAAGGYRLLDMMGAIARSPAFHARGVAR